MQLRMEYDFLNSLLDNLCNTSVIEIIILMFCAKIKWKFTQCWMLYCMSKMILRNSLEFSYQLLS